MTSLCITRQVRRRTTPPSSLAKTREEERDGTRTVTYFVSTAVMTRTSIKYIGHYGTLIVYCFEGRCNVKLIVVSAASILDALKPSYHVCMDCPGWFLNTVHLLEWCRVRGRRLLKSVMTLYCLWNAGWSTNDYELNAWRLVESAKTRS